MEKISEHPNYYESLVSKTRVIIEDEYLLEALKNICDYDSVLIDLPKNFTELSLISHIKNQFSDCEVVDFTYKNGYVDVEFQCTYQDNFSVRKKGNPDILDRSIKFPNILCRIEFDVEVLRSIE